MVNDLSTVDQQGKALAFDVAKQYFLDNANEIGSEPVTTHHWGGGVYARCMRLSEGETTAGHKHAGACLNVIALGHVRVINLADSEMVVELRAGDIFESPADTQRLIVAVEPSCWITLHLDTGERDLDKIKEGLAQ